jgi:hypothetical protein
MFPLLAKHYHLGGLQIQQTSNREVGDKRCAEIQQFATTPGSVPPKVHCNLDRAVYVFVTGIPPKRPILGSVDGQKSKVLLGYFGWLSWTFGFEDRWGHRAPSSSTP